MDPRLQRRVQRYGWNKAAAYYEQFWASQLRPAQDLMLDLAALRPGERVLDLACGTGLVTFRAADAIGPTGRITATDISEDMVAMVAEEAARRGVAGDFRRMDAEVLDLPDASFDAALCALGLMYVAEPLNAAREMHRVLAAGGRAAAVVWGERRKCGWAEIFPIVERRTASEVCPMFYALGTGGTLARTFEQAGFREVRAETISVPIVFPTADDAIGAAFIGGPVALAYSRFTEDVRASAHAEYLASIRGVPGGRGLPRARPVRGRRGIALKESDMNRVWWSAALVAAVLWVGVDAPVFGQLPPYGGVAELRADLAARRARAMDALGPDAVLVAWSAPAKVYSTDVNYEYRQESNMLYLSGMTQEETILVLVPGAKSRREILFTREADPRREHWNGHTLTPAEVTAESGIATVYPLSAFQPFMDGLLGGVGYQMTPDAAAAEFGPFLDAVKAGKARLGIFDRVGPPPGGRGASPNQPPSAPAPGSPAAWAVQMQAKFPGVTPFTAAPIITTLRQVKTPYEQKVLTRSVEISADAHIEGMKAARPGRWEYEVEAAIEYWYMKNGAMSWGYPSIVGSGPNATTLHYGASTRQMQNGDLLLVDAAANFQGLTGDITRTYPVNGKFTPAQREIYELVLRAQNAGIAAATLGAPAAGIAQACRTVFAEGLLKLGLITESAPGPAQTAQVSRWFTHGPTHGIGVDVHDPLGQTLVAGSAFVIEPGLYIREAALTDLPNTPDNAAFIEKVRPAVEKYKNIGVRIEDSFLMTDKGLITLSAKAPRLVAEIEKVVGTGK